MLIGATCSVRKIVNQSLAAAVPAPPSTTTKARAATEGRRRNADTLVREDVGARRPVADAGASDRRRQARSTSTSATAALGSAARTSSASRRATSSPTWQSAQSCTCCRSDTATPDGSSSSRRSTFSGMAHDEGDGLLAGDPAEGSADAGALLAGDHVVGHVPGDRVVARRGVRLVRGPPSAGAEQVERRVGGGHGQPTLASFVGTVVRPKDRNTSCATSSASSREPSTRPATPTTIR